MSKERRICAYCGNNRFGLTRHYVGFNHHLCTKLCKERFLERRAREFADYRSWLASLPQSPPPYHGR
jgi:hypothetical protein